MKTAQPTKLLRILTGSAIALLAHSAHAQFSLTGSSYSQDFDALTSTGTATTTISGWFVGTTTTNTSPNGAISGTTVTVGTGSSSSGGNYNFGVTGTNAITDRALGSLASSSTSRATEFRFTNSTGNNISSLTLSYAGEQWRAGGGAAVSNVLDLFYSYDGTTFTALGSGFNSTSPITPGTAGPLDGNASANRVTGIGGIFSLPTILNNGSTFYLRWRDTDNSSSDHALAVDDFSMSVAFAAATLYWDTTGATAGLGGSGTWDTTTTNWSSAAAGDVATTTFTATSPVVFDGTAGTVTVDAGGVSANGGITINTGGYSFTGGTITLGNPSIAAAHASGITTLGAQLAGSVGLTLSGTGTVELTAANTFTGNIAAGAQTVRFSADGNFGAVANDIALSGTTLAPQASVTLDAGRDLSGSTTVDIATGNTLTVQGNATLTTLTRSGSGSTVFSGATNSLGAVTFATGSSGATVAVNGATSNTVTGVTFTDPGTLSSTSTLTLSGNVSSTQTTGTATVSAVTIALGGAQRTFTIADGANAVDAEITGALTSTGTATRFFKLGDGTLRLTGTNGAGHTGGTRIGTAGTTPAAGGRLLISDKNALGSSQLQFNDGILQNEGSALTGANALPIGISIGAGQGAAATFSGSAMEFTGASSLFKPASTSYEHKIAVNTAVTLSGSLDASTSGGASTGLRISGTGSLTLAGASNAHDIPVTLSGATLNVNGALTSTAASITVESIATLAGNSTIAGAVTVTDGFLLPGTSGDSTATLGTGSLSLTANALLGIDLAGAAAGDFDTVNVTGTVTLTSAVLNLSLLGGFTPSLNTAFTIINNDSTDTIIGTFTGLAEGASVTVGATEFQITYAGGTDANDVVITAVPEPGTIATLLGGFALLALRRRRS